MSALTRAAAMLTGGICRKLTLPTPPRPGKGLAEAACALAGARGARPAGPAVRVGRAVPGEQGRAGHPAGTALAHLPGTACHGPVRAVLPLTNCLSPVAGSWYPERTMCPPPRR